MSYNNCKFTTTLKQAYKLLDVAPDADFNQIKRSYRRAARLYHPDINPDMSSNEKFCKVVAAYNLVLKNRKWLNDPDSSRPSGLASPKPGITWLPFCGMLKRSRERLLTLIYGGKNSDKNSASSCGEKSSPTNGDSRSKSELYKLIYQFDKADESTEKIKMAHAIYARFRENFEWVAISRLPRVDTRTQVELIWMLGQLGTKRALEVIGPYVKSRNKRIVGVAFLALDRAGPTGQAILDKSLSTSATLGRRVMEVFYHSPLDKRMLKSRIVSSAQLRRLKAVMRSTGLPFDDVLKLVGISIPRSA